MGCRVHDGTAGGHDGASVGHDWAAGATMVLRGRMMALRGPRWGCGDHYDAGRSTSEV